jgi:hypothetical protein
MISNGLELALNEYGLELDSFLGAIYLPWHTIIITAIAVIGYKVYKKIKNKKITDSLLTDTTSELWGN